MIFQGKGADKSPSAPRSVQMDKKRALAFIIGRVEFPSLFFALASAIARDSQDLLYWSGCFEDFKAASNVAHRRHMLS
jgi:hypothetical protein